jgi:hypothetical protein
LVTGDDLGLLAQQHAPVLVRSRPGASARRRAAATSPIPCAALSPVGLPEPSSAQLPGALADLAHTLAEPARTRREPWLTVPPSGP